MRVRLLGPVELRGPAGAVALGTPRQQCVFTVLALSPRQSVPVETLVERVWAERAPRSVRTVLYTYISRLRGLLQQAAAGEPGAGQPLLRRRDGGYALELSPAMVDLHRSRQLATQARAAAAERASGGDRRAADLLAQACRLWCGPPLAGVTGDWADRVRTGLEHERLALLTERFETELRVGGHEAVIGPLSETLAAHPLTESLTRLLMLALHRAGRSAEALNVYAQLRRRMVDELGDEPGVELRRLHERVLRRDPALDPPVRQLAVATGSPPTAGPAPAAAAPAATATAAAAAASPTSAAWVRMCQLPPDLWHFVGREPLVEQLAAALEPDPQRAAVPVVTISGAPGSGKTALATRVAHRLRARFPDGQWFVPLGGMGSPADPWRLLGELLANSGVDPAAVPAGREQRAAALRARLADRRVLVVLDDAAGAAQLRPLLPGTGGAAVLVTARRRPGGLAETGVHARLGPLPPTEALSLLARLAGPQRVAAEPAAATEICAACGFSPLALQIAAARLAAHPEWRLERFAARLRERDRRLDELAIGDLAVRPALRHTHLALDTRSRGALGRLARLGTEEFTPETAAALAGVDDGERLVEELVAATLVDPVDTGATAEPRYRLPELVAAYAAELPVTDASS